MRAVAAAAPASSSSSTVASTAVVPSNNKRRRKNLGVSNGEIRLNELRYQAFVPPVFIPPSRSQRLNDARQLDQRCSTVYSHLLYDDSTSYINCFSEIPRLLESSRQTARASAPSSNVLLAEAAGIRPGARIARSGRAGQELRELVRGNQQLSICEKLRECRSYEIFQYTAQLEQDQEAHQQQQQQQQNAPGAASASGAVSASAPRPTSGSHEFALVCDQLTQFETAFAQLDALQFDSALFARINEDLQDCVAYVKSRGDPALTPQACWQIPELMRFLVHKNIPRALRPDDPDDTQAVCEAGELHRRIRSLDANRWAAVAATVPHVPRKRAKKTLVDPKSAEIVSRIAARNHSGISPAQLREAATQLSRQVEKVRSWQAKVNAAYDVRILLCHAETLLEEGIQLLSDCDITEALMSLEADIATCRAVGTSLRAALPPLFAPGQHHCRSLQVPQLVPWVQQCESLPFEIPESFALCREMKLAITWREIATAAVAEGDMQRCRLLLKPACPTALELPPDIRAGVNTTRWLEKLTAAQHKSISQTAAEDLLSNMPAVPNLAQTQPAVADLLQRYIAACHWLSTLLQPKFRSLFGEHDLTAIENTARIWQQRLVLPQVYQIVTNEPLPPLAVPPVRPPTCPEDETYLCTAVDLDRLVARNAAEVRISFPCLRQLEQTRQRLSRWTRRVGATRRLVNDVQSILDEGRILVKMVHIVDLLRKFELDAQEFKLWAKEAGSVLKHYRKALADADAARASAGHALQLESLLLAPADEESPGKILEAIEALRVAGPVRNRPELSAVESLLRAPRGCISDEAMERQLTLIAEKGRQWRKRGEALLAGRDQMESPMQFERQRLQLLVESRTLAVDAALEQELLS